MLGYTVFGAMVCLGLSGCSQKPSLEDKPLAIRSAISTIAAANVVHTAGLDAADDAGLEVRIRIPRTSVYHAYLTLAGFADDEVVEIMLGHRSPAVRAYGAFIACERDLFSGRERTEALQRDGALVYVYDGRIGEQFEVLDLARTARTQPDFLRRGPELSSIHGLYDEGVIPAVHQLPTELGRHQIGGDPLRRDDPYAR